MLIDFHTHTTASDGALDPCALLARAQALSITALAITDHDTIAGFEAVRQSPPTDLRLIAGIEISCVWGGVTIHVVGLGFDPDASAIQALLARLDDARRQRAVKIAERLASRNMPGGLDGARAIAGAAQIGRPHFAQWMVQAGHVVDTGTAFSRYLGQGKVGDIKAFWPALREAVEGITDSGGVAVLAHPLKYRMTRMKLQALCRDFASAGGLGLEILNGRQTSDETARLKRLAQEFQFAVSVGSDFHRDWQYGADLGVDSRVVGTMPTVWESLL